MIRHHKFGQGGIMTMTTILHKARIGMVLATIVAALVLPCRLWAEEAMKIGATFQDCATCPKMIIVPAGRFTMGQDLNTAWESAGELPRHQVTIPALFAVGIYEVTQAEYVAVMGDNPSRFTGDLKRPVEMVTWDDAMTYAAKLSAKTGYAYRLPSEAEWEYVARGGKQSPWFFHRTVDNPGVICGAITWLLNDYAWTTCTLGVSTSVVGRKRSNPFGLYDIYGNVAEWVTDCFHTNYTSAPLDGLPWSTSACSWRVVRGGSWYDSPINTRSSRRTGYSSTSRSNAIGFRVIRTINRTQTL
jgi:formylglycine-generating enzyme required for sulfatase activity